VIVDYIIMDVACAYNIVVGRPLLNSLRATLSICDLEMQCLIDNGSVERSVRD